jgi:hypothetical protein
MRGPHAKANVSALALNERIAHELVREVVRPHRAFASTSRRV